MANIFERYWHYIRTRFSKEMDTFLLISIGVILGANLRYWVGTWADGQLGTSFPYGRYSAQKRKWMVVVDAAGKAIGLVDRQALFKAMMHQVEE